MPAKIASLCPFRVQHIRCLTSLVPLLRCRYFWAVQSHSQVLCKPYSACSRGTQLCKYRGPTRQYWFSALRSLISFLSWVWSIPCTGENSSKAQLHILERTEGTASMQMYITRTGKTSVSVWGTLLSTTALSKCL